MRNTMIAAVTLCMIAACTQPSGSSGPARATVVLRLSFEDTEGARVLRELRLSQDQLERDDHTKEFDAILRRETANRSGTARIESITTVRDVVTGKVHDVRFEVVSQIVNGYENGLQESFAGGRKIRKLLLHDGIFHGYEHHYWLPTAQLSLCGNWNEGKRNGSWAAYYVNGRLGFQWQMKDDVLEGRAVAWSPEGVKIADGLYRGGSPREGTFIDAPGGFERRVLVPNPSSVYMPSGTYKLLTYKRGSKTAESPLDVPFAQSEYEPWKAFAAEVEANDGKLPNKRFEAD